MAECNTSKRQREETVQQNDDDQVCVLETESKKHKSFNHILSLLDEEEEEPTQDLSSLITTLQQELSSENPTSLTSPYQENISSLQLNTTIEDYASSSSSTSSSSCCFLKEDEDDDKERVIRHLLEASDDELGIPNREEAVNGCEDEKDGFFGGGEGGFPVCCDGLWEFEDVNANYYALLQSELFM